MWKRWFWISDWAFEPACGQRRESRCGSAAICHLNRGHMGQACPCPPLGRVVLSFSCGFLRTPCVVVRFYAHRHRPDGDAAERGWSRTMEPERGPAAGWGSILCCWSGCHVTPCGDDCAIYCLAGAGDRRRWSRTGPEKTDKFLKSSSFNLTSSGLVREGECVQAWRKPSSNSARIPSWIHRCKNNGNQRKKNTPNRLLVSCGSREVSEIWLKIKYLKMTCVF